MAQSWRIPMEVELQKFQTHCLPTDLDVQFSCENLSPSAAALELYKSFGTKQMTDPEVESPAPSVYSDYDTLEQEMVDVAPRKKTRSVKGEFRDAEISGASSPIRPKRVAWLPKVKMPLPRQLPKAKNASTPSLESRSIVTLPNLPFVSKTPTRQQSSKDASLTSTPYNRCHTTGRKYLCARCINAKLFCCWISFNTNLLEAAHLVPHYLAKTKHRQLLEPLRQAIGGRFSVNSRLNYLLLHQPIHTIFDKQGAIVYPIQTWILDAVDKYLSWLDSQDGGQPWVNGQEPVDYFKYLRSGHPLLSDGHEYAIRFTALKDEAVDIILYKKYLEVGQPPDLETVVRRPYAQIPTRKVFANPILLLLNLIYQLDKTFDNESVTTRSWSWTTEEWKDWIKHHLKHLVGLTDVDPLTNKSHLSVDVLAYALVVAGHLRRRLPPQFEWATEKNAPDNESELFSGPSTSYSRSHHGPSSSHQGGPGSRHGRGDAQTKAGGSGGSGGPIVRGAQTGEKRRHGEATDCTAMVEDWRLQNSKPRRSLWGRLFQSKGNVSGDGIPLNSTEVGLGKIFFWDIVNRLSRISN